MRLRRWLLATMATMAMVTIAIGCDRSPDTSAPTTAPALPPDTVLDPATAPTTKPTASFMKINNRLAMFPPAKLKLTDDGSRLIALFYSDDPPDAINDDYAGNSFYLQMVLDVSDPKDLCLATWRHQARSQKFEDTPCGIYLNGRKVQLQPYNVTASFSPGDNQSTVVQLWGNFLLWNSADATGLPQSVALDAELPVQVESEAIAQP